jgi:cellulose biosynthesis protein BcsQ
MTNIRQIKISEIANFSKSSIPLVSRYFKNSSNSKVTRINNRIIGISPEAAEEYLKHIGLNYFYRPAIILSANLCGGVGKTSAANNLHACLRRITNRNTAIVCIDTDPQGSFTANIFGSPANDNEPILIDFLEGKAAIDNVLISSPVGDNIWFVKSNLNQVFVDKILNRPQAIKSGMLGFYKAIFDKLGSETKIFQDHTPQLSSIFTSSICALNQLSDVVLKAVIIPIRGDKFAIQGADYIIREINELTTTFGFQNMINTHCFFSSLDRRVSTTGDAIQVAATNQNIVKYMSSAVIRYSSELPKSIMANNNVYSSGKTNNATTDYQELLQSIFSYSRD